MWPISVGVVAVVIAAIVIPVVLTRSSTKYTLALTHPIAWNTLSGLQKSKPPWPANANDLTQRVAKIGLEPLGQEQLQFHIHQHLDLWVNGQKVTIPQYAGIKIDQAAQTAVFAELHTHNSTGIIHDESARAVRFELAQFFGVWGVRLTQRCIGSFKGSCGTVQMWVNGTKYTGNPANLVLRNHQEIVLVLGKPPASIPKSFPFASYGL